MRKRPNELRKNKARLYRHFLTSLLLAAVMAMGLCTAVSAETVLGTPKDCSINLQLGYTDSKTNKRVQLTGGEVTVYKVSDALEDDGNKYFNPKTSGQFQSLARKTTADGQKIAAIRTISSEELTKQNAALAKILAAKDAERYGALSAKLEKRNEKAVRRKREKTQRADSKRNGKRRTEV